jgi:hypothetical protein
MGDADRGALNIYQERSMRIRLTEFLVGVVGLLLLWPLAAAFWGLACVIAIALVFSDPVRRAGAGLWQEVVMVVVLIFFQFIVAFLFKRFFDRILYGGPWFGELSKMQRSLVATVLRASGELSFTLDDKNRQLIQELANLNRDVLKWSMGRQYRIMNPDTVVEPASEAGIVRRLLHGRQRPDPDARWNDVWRTEILASSSGGRTMAQAFEPDSYAWVTVPNRLTQLRLGVVIMTSFCEIAVLWLLISGHASQASLLPVLQVAVGFSVATTLIIFLIHSYGLPEIPILFPGDVMQLYGRTLWPKQKRVAMEEFEALEGAFKERFDGLAGKSIVVTSVRVTPRYFGLVRNYYARSLAYEAVDNSLIGFVLILLSIAFLRIFGTARSDAATIWLYERVAIALVVLPVAILGIYFLVFTLVAQFRTFATLAITGGLIAFIPPVITYLVSGRLPTSPTAFVSSAVVGIIGSAGADLALRIRKKVAD